MTKKTDTKTKDAPIADDAPQDTSIEKVENPSGETAIEKTPTSAAALYHEGRTAAEAMETGVADFPRAAIYQGTQKEKEMYGRDTFVDGTLINRMTLAPIIDARDDKSSRRFVCINRTPIFSLTAWHDETEHPIFSMRVDPHGPITNIPQEYLKDGAILTSWDREEDEVQIRFHRNFIVLFEPNPDAIDPESGEVVGESWSDIEPVMVAFGWTSERAGKTIQIVEAQRHVAGKGPAIWNYVIGQKSSKKGPYYSPRVTPMGDPGGEALKHVQSIAKAIQSPNAIIDIPW